LPSQSYFLPSPTGSRHGWSGNGLPRMQPRFGAIALTV